VVTSAFPSVRAAYLDKSFGISVCLTSLYNKLQGIEAPVASELVRHSARQFLPLLDHLGGTLPEPVPGYSMNVLDGNAIAATEHRLEETRDSSAAPLPGKSLCVFRPRATRWVRPTLDVKAHLGYRRRKRCADQEGEKPCQRR
jgi:hypothetical protein